MRIAYYYCNSVYSLCHKGWNLQEITRSLGDGPDHQVTLLADNPREDRCDQYPGELGEFYVGVGGPTAGWELLQDFDALMFSDLIDIQQVAAAYPHLKIYSLAISVESIPQVFLDPPVTQVLYSTAQQGSHILEVVEPSRCQRLPQSYVPDTFLSESSPRYVGDPIRLMMVAKGHEDKNHHLAVQAVDVLRSEGLDIRLSLYGVSVSGGCSDLPGSVLAWLQEQVITRPWLQIKERVPNEDLPVEYRQHTASILPSAHEGPCMAALE